MNRLEFNEVIKAFGIGKPLSTTTGRYGSIENVHYWGGLAIYFGGSYYTVVNGRIPLEVANIIYGKYPNNPYNIRVDGGSSDWNPVSRAVDDKYEKEIQEYIDKIGNNIGKEVISILEANFTTTNSAILTTSQVSIMSSMKQYFTYSLLMGGCGISSITLEGSIEDWQKLKSKLEFLETKALKWWTKHLIPIIDNIIETKEYYKKHNKINNKLVEFWKNMIRLKGKGDLYDPHMINGWIIKFIPDYSQQKPKLYEEIKETEVPDEIISCPLELIILNLDGTKSECKCDLASGFYGMVQNKETEHNRQKRQNRERKERIE